MLSYYYLTHKLHAFGRSIEGSGGGEPDFVAVEPSGAYWCILGDEEDGDKAERVWGIREKDENVSLFLSHTGNFHVDCSLRFQETRESRRLTPFHQLTKEGRIDGLPHLPIE